jgi:peptidoglycan/LPS O-acetylase OafA/YrhL
MNTKTERRFDLDWMRVIAILVVFVFHSTRFFSYEPWHVNNLARYAVADSFQEFLGYWMMPFIFVISGASLYYALGKGKILLVAGKFIKDKVLRLLVPLVVNVFSLCILQVYLERLTRGQFTGSFFEFLPQSFDGIYGLGGNAPIIGMHLWYVTVLFIFSIVLLPVFMLLKSRIGSLVMQKTTNVIAFPGLIYVVVLLVTLLWKTIDPGSILGFDKFNWNLGVYMTYLIFGFVLISSERLQKTIKNLRWVSLALAVAMTVLLIAGDEHDDLISWSYVLTFLGFGFRYLNVERPFIRYAGEAVLPFYILHQTVLLCVGYFVMAWAIPDVLKWVITTAVSFVIIMAAYEYLVRRINLLRVLFGMKWIKRSPQTAAQVTPPLTQKV